MIPVTRNIIEIFLIITEKSNSFSKQEDLVGLPPMG